MHQAAQSLYEQARSALAEQRTEDADALLRRAAASCPPGDIALGLRIRISASWVVFEREGLTAALAAVRSVRSAAAAAGLTEVVASASVQQGILHARSGDLAQAWRCLARVDATALALPDRMRMLMNRGTIASELHHLDEAADDLQTAADLADQVGVAPLQFMARHNLGWVQFLRGDLPAAVLSACEVGLTTHRPGDQPLGLTSMLLSSGVASVIAPVAPVNDELAVQVMSDYHQGLSAGVPSADALAAAVGDDPRAGAFVCFGAPWRVGVGSQG